MKNIAIIFAGGAGKRMNINDKPKQFLECNGKPILIYTLEVFNKHPLVDGIIIVMLDGWIDYTRELVKNYSIEKVIDIIPGEKTGQKSIYNGIKRAYQQYGDNNVVLIHDGVRPLIDSDTITKCIECVKENGSAITVSNAIETVIIKSNTNEVKSIMNRSACQYARAPQCFILGDIYKIHNKAITDEKFDFIDSACLMNNYGYSLYTVEGKPENIKITTPNDYYMFCSLIESKKYVDK